MITYSLKAKDIKKKWYLIDANGLVLGRLASKISMILRGKKTKKGEEKRGKKRRKKRKREEREEKYRKEF